MVKVKKFFCLISIGIEKNFSSRRLICAWHLQRHFVSRFSGLCKRNRSLYDKAIILPFIKREEKFDKLIEELKKPGNMTEEEKKYLDSKLETKHTWAKCCLKNRFAAGVSTTSRIEGMHKMLKDYLNSNSTLTELFATFVKIETNQIQTYEEEFQRHSKNIETVANNCKLIEELSKIYSPYILKKMKQKFNKSLSYKNEEIISAKSW